MPDSSTKPYLIRAIHEWCTDSGYTPYLAVAVDDRTEVPREFVRSGEIVLNVSTVATSRLVLGNDLITFHARFGGVAREISIPVQNVSAIYARENGHGMAFEVPKALAEPGNTPRSAGSRNSAHPSSNTAAGARAADATDSAQPSLLPPEPRPALGLVPSSSGKPRAPRRGAASKPTVVAGTDRRRAPALSLAASTPASGGAPELATPAGVEHAARDDSPASVPQVSGKSEGSGGEPDAPPPTSSPSPPSPAAPGTGPGSGRGRGRSPGKPRLTRVK